AHDLGARLGTGAHLTSLRRTRSGDCTLADAIALADAEEDAARARQSVIPMSRMLPRFPAVTLSAAGVVKATHGIDLTPADAASSFIDAMSSLVTGAPAAASAGPIRLLDEQGRLIGIGERAAASGLLHPSVVLL